MNSPLRPSTHALTIDDLPTSQQREVEQLARQYQQPPHRMSQREAMQQAFRQISREWNQKQQRTQSRATTAPLFGPK